MCLLYLISPSFQLPSFYAMHKNTDNCHMHIVVNRTHPYTQKVIQPHHGFDIEAAHKIIAEIEHKQGWASQQNARYRVNEQGHVVRDFQHREQESSGRRRKILKTPRTRSPRSASPRNSGTPLFRTPRAGKSCTPAWTPWACVSPAKVPAR